MNDKQLTAIAYNRAWKKLKPLNFVLMVGFIAMFVLSFITNNELLVFPMVGILFIQWGAIYVKTNKIKGEIIKNKDSQVLTDKDINGISADKAMKTNKYWIVTCLCGILFAISWLDKGMPMYYRCALVISGILGVVILIMWVRKKANSFREQVKKDFNK